MARMKRTSRRGAALVEFALVGALLCLLLFGIVEVGLIFGDQTQVGAAAREAARSLSVGETTTNARSRATAAGVGLSRSATTVTLESSLDGTVWTALGDTGSANTAPAGNLVRATVTYRHPLVTSFVFAGTTRTLTARLVMRRE